MSVDVALTNASLEQFRAYLRGLAPDRFGHPYGAKLDPSDVVQQTFLDALENLEQFRGGTDGEFATWLKEIFANNLADVFRALNRQRRDVARERSSERLADWLESIPTESANPSDLNEGLVRLAWALSELPELQHTAIELHHLQGLSFAETAKRLGRSEPSAAGLVRRGMERLRELLGNAEALP